MSDTPIRPTRDLIRMVTSTPGMPSTYHLGDDHFGDDAHLVRALGLREDGEDSSVGTIYGYPVVYNVWTRIDSWWEGLFLERVAPEALDSWFKMGMDRRVRNLFQHGMDFQIGDKPLGKPSVQRSEDFGLYSETPLADTDYNRDQIAPLIRDGALDGQSFRFDILGEEWKVYADGEKRPSYNPDGLDERTITRMTVPEHGPVTFPAYETTTLGLRTASEMVAWNQADDEVRMAMLRAKGIANAQDVVQRMRNGDRSVHQDETLDVESQDDRDDTRDEQGEPQPPVATNVRRDASLYSARAEIALRRTESYARR